MYTVPLTPPTQSVPDLVIVCIDALYVIRVEIAYGDGRTPALVVVGALPVLFRAAQPVPVEAHTVHSQDLRGLVLRIDVLGTGRLCKNDHNTHREREREWGVTYNTGAESVLTGQTTTRANDEIRDLVRDYFCGCVGS